MANKPTMDHARNIFSVRHALLLCGAAVMVTVALPFASDARAAPAAASPLKLPACETMASWGDSIDPRNTYLVAPRVAVPKALQEPAFSATFGKPALSWTDEDFQAAKQAISDCYDAARKRRDRAAGHALAEANGGLTRLLPKVIATLDRSKDAAEAAQKAIDALPNSAELDQGLGILLGADPAAPNVNALHSLPREVGEPIFHLAQTLPGLADDERQVIFKTLADRRATIQTGMTGDAEKTIATAPADATGIIALLEARLQLAKLADANTRARLQQSIDQRVSQITDSLRKAKPATWVPPRCIDIYRWAAAPGAMQGTVIGPNTIWTLYSDERAVPVFGISVADWTDDNLTEFRKLRDYCHAEVRALGQQASHGSLPADEAALVEAAGKSGWIDDKSRDSLAVTSRTVLLENRKAVAALQAIEAKITALPDSNDSLAQLNQFRTDPVLNQLGQNERNQFAGVFNAKLASIGAAATKSAISGLNDIKVAELGDLQKLPEYAAKTITTIPGQQAQLAFDAAYNTVLRTEATKLLPQFQAKLDAMPVGPQGIEQASTAVAKLTGINDHGRLAGLQPLREAANKRVDVIIKTMRHQACDGLLSELGVGSDATQIVWDGGNGVALGDLICSLAEHGATVSAYSGGGLFSSTSTLKITMPGNALQTFSLHKAEVQPGKQMLVGFEAKDANEDHKITVDEWASFTRMANAQVMADTDGCRQFANSDPDKVAAAQKPYMLQCILQFAGMGNRGR